VIYRISSVKQRSRQSLNFTLESDDHCRRRRIMKVNKKKNKHRTRDVAVHKTVVFFSVDASILSIVGKTKIDMRVGRHYDR